MPQRPRQHQLREASERALRAALPLEWVSQPMHDDYGLDFHVEIFSRQRPTGNAFYVQLKGTDNADLLTALRLRLRLDTADYWAAQALPVLVVRYHAPSDTLYAQWFHTFDPHIAGLAPDWQEQQTFTFTIPQARQWSDAMPELLSAEVAAFRHYRTGDLALPVRFHVGVEADVAVTALEFTSQLTVAAKPVDHIVSFTAAVPPEGAPTLHLRANAIRASLADIASVTSHVGFANTPIESLATDAVLVTGILLDRVRQPNLGAQIALATATRSSLLNQPDVVWWIATVLARAHRIGEALTLADQLDSNGDDIARLAGQMIGASFLAQGPGGRSAFRDQYNSLLERNAERRLAEDDHHGAASHLYSLANSVRAARNARGAIRIYLRCAHLDSAYRHAPYWNAELGGMLFEAGHPLLASAFYRRAVELGEPGMARALLADTLLNAGRYLDVLPTDVVNAADRGSVSDRAVWSAPVVVVEPVWQRLGALSM